MNSKQLVYAEPEKWNVFIRDKIKQLNEKYDEKADPIPVYQIK